MKKEMEVDSVRESEIKRASEINICTYVYGKIEGEVMREIHRKRDLEA